MPLFFFKNVIFAGSFAKSEDMNKLHGLIYGIVSSATFGLIPLFALPLMQQGMDFMNILVYRFLFATLALAVLLKARNISFRIEKTDFPILLLLSVFYLVSSVFLLWGYKFMPSGIATTLHFMYPVVTTLLMMLLFHEKNSLWRSLAITLAIGGVYALTRSGSQGSTGWVGIFIVLLSALGYASYLVTIGRNKRTNLQGLRLTFYVFLLGTLMLVAGTACSGTLCAIPDWTSVVNLLMLAIVPTIVSNLTLIEAIKRIGATQASVLGAMEPLTAVMIGIVVFGEAFTLSIALGIVLIITAVTIIILQT